MALASVTTLATYPNGTVAEPRVRGVSAEVIPARVSVPLDGQSEAVIRVTNRDEATTEVRIHGTSCDCVKVSPSAHRVEPNQTVEFNLTIDFHGGPLPPHPIAPTVLLRHGSPPRAIECSIDVVAERNRPAGGRR